MAFTTVGRTSMKHSAEPLSQLLGLLALALILARMTLSGVSEGTLDARKNDIGEWVDSFIQDKEQEVCTPRVPVQCLALCCYLCSGMSANEAASKQIFSCTGVQYEGSC
jgi:hypothetical protein